MLVIGIWSWVGWLRTHGCTFPLVSALHSISCSFSYQPFHLCFSIITLRRRFSEQFEYPSFVSVSYCKGAMHLPWAVGESLMYNSSFFQKKLSIGIPGISSQSIQLREGIFLRIFMSRILYPICNHLRLLLAENTPDPSKRYIYSRTDSR